MKKLILSTIILGALTSSLQAQQIKKDVLKDIVITVTPSTKKTFNLYVPLDINNKSFKGKEQSTGALKMFCQRARKVYENSTIVEKEEIKYMLIRGDSIGVLQIEFSDLENCFSTEKLFESRNLGCSTTIILDPNIEQVISVTQNCNSKVRSEKERFKPSRDNNESNSISSNNITVDAR